MDTITYIVTRYVDRKLIERHDGLTVDQAEQFIRTHAGQGSVLCGASINGRMLEDIYKDMGSTVYAQPFSIGSPLSGDDQART